MVVVKKKGNLKTKETESSFAFRKVTKWHVGEIFCLASAFLVSSTACLCLSYVNYALYPDCILYSKWKCLSSYNYQITLDPPKTQWGKKAECYLTQYGQAAAAVTAFILCWFFVFFRPTKEAYFFKKKTAASKLILPSILICLIFTITVFVATITLQRGVNNWCKSFLDESSGCNVNECSLLGNYTIVNGQKTVNGNSARQKYFNYYHFLIAAQVFSWISAFIWLTNLLVLIVRCYLHLDFPTYFFEKEAAAPTNNNSLQTETDSD